MKQMIAVGKRLAVLGALHIAMLGAAMTVLPAQAAVTVPAQGPQIDVETARKQLKDDMATKIAEFLKVHNDARAEVGVGPLVWDEKLAAYAQEWADTLAAKGDDIEHRTDLKVGENLAAYTHTGSRPAHGAKQWYDEIENYDAVNNTKKDAGGKAIGHYTQMVWSGSTKVGFGVAMSANGWIILVANYDPPGNMNGEHPYKK